MLLHLEGGLDGGLQIAQIVHGVEDAEYIDAVGGRALDELPYHIVCVVAITEDILSTEQHLHRRIRHGLLEDADALPGILTQETDTGIEGGAAPGLERPEPHLIELFCNRQHIVDTHAGRKQGLMRIAQYYFSDAKWFYFAHKLAAVGL